MELEFLHKSKESPNTDTYAQNKKSEPQTIYPHSRESKGKQKSTTLREEPTNGTGTDRAKHMCNTWNEEGQLKKTLHIHVVQAKLQSLHH